MTLNLSKKIVYPSLQARKEKEYLEEQFKTRLPYTIDKEYIPKDDHEFYIDFGPLIHPRTGQEVKRLTKYQYDIWNCPAKTVLVDKSQKTGITTSELIHDFQEVILNGRGKDLLIVGQTEKAAIEHLYTLKRLIIDSPKYRKYLITKSSELFFREEQTKAGTLFIKNPDNPFRPMRIIGLAFIVSALWSWKNVFRIHMSDPAAAQVVDDSQIYAALTSRLTNTDGRMMIEGPPRGPFGRFYELYEQFKDNKNPNFKVFLVTIYDALKEGLVTQQFIAKVREELGQLYPQTYEGSFVAGLGDVFTEESIINAISFGERAIIEFPKINAGNIMCLGVDPGFGSSKTALCLTESIKDQDTIIVRFTKEYSRPNPEEIASICFDFHRKYWNAWVIVDGANAGFVHELQIAFNERPDVDYTISPNSNFVIPINLNKDHKNMLSKLYLFLNKGYIAIPKEHENLITSFRTAKATEYSLDKQQTSFNDLLDACRLSLYGYRIK